MITFTQGNLLTANAEALVNTVNTAGVMGKGIALMFKEAFPENTAAYEKACANKEVQVGEVFVTELHRLSGPRWIINFPTKKHWRNPSRMEWIEAGLISLREFIRQKDIKSVAIPPLGSGNGGLDWQLVRPLIVQALSDLDEVQIIIYEPTDRYQNVAKASGKENLTPARALVAELVRQYWILGFECTILEVQKLAYLLENSILRANVDDPLKLHFSANRFGPYAPNLMHLLNSIDGSYLQCSKRLADASPMDVIWFKDEKKDLLNAYFKSEGKQYRDVLDHTSNLIDGFQSPLGMELLATVHWLVVKEKVAPTTASVQSGLDSWPGGAEAGKRKKMLFSGRLIDAALDRMETFQMI